MPQPAHHSLAIGHPAPRRSEVNPLILLFALVGGPIVWIIELTLNFAITSYACYTGEAHVVLATVPSWVQPTISALNLCALIIALLAAATGFAVLHRIGNEHEERSGGVMDVGEGRTRFLATWGVFGALVFAVALFANTFSLFLVPICRA
jgi:hypothetical protein